MTSYFLASFIWQNRVFFYFAFLFRRCLKRQAIASKRFIENIFSKRQTCKKNVFYVSKHTFSHSQKKRKDSLEGTLVGVLFAAELEFPKILVPRLLQHTSNVNIETTAKSKQLQLLFVSSFLEPWYIFLYCYDISLFLIDYASRKLCNKWLLLFENNSRSLTLKEKHCCSYYWR